MRYSSHAGARRFAVLPALAALAALAAIGALGCGLAGFLTWALLLTGLGVFLIVVQVALTATRRGTRRRPAAAASTRRVDIEPLEVVERPRLGDSRPLPDVPPARLHEPVVLDEIVRLAVDAARPSAQVRDHHLDVHINLHGELVAGNPRQLTQILVSLLADAVRSTDAGGVIVVTARCDQDAATISVANSGAGLGRDLSRVREIAAQHGGRLDVHIADDGARRVVTLPVLARAA